MKKLKNLANHNSIRSHLHNEMNSNEQILNGIACPKCGTELYDSNPMITLTSIPPKKNIHCNKCDYVGYRVA